MALIIKNAAVEGNESIYTKSKLRASKIEVGKKDRKIQMWNQLTLEDLLIAQIITCKYDVL